MGKWNLIIAMLLIVLVGFALIMPNNPMLQGDGNLIRTYVMGAWNDYSTVWKSANNLGLGK